MARRFVSASGRYFAGPGGRFIAGAAAGVTAATGYTVALATSSGAVGAPVLLMVTPTGGNWSAGQTISLALSGVTATLGNPYGATLAGSTLTPTGSGAFAVAVVPASSGLLIITPHGSGLTDPAPVTYTASNAPAALSGLVWNQPNPVPTSTPAYWIIGWLTPVGGIGPYRFSANSGNFQINQQSGEVTVYYDTSFSQVPLNPVFTVTDGRNATTTVTATIATTATAGLCANWRTPISNGDNRAYSNIHPGLNAPGQTLTVTDRTTGSAPTAWRFEYNALRWGGGDGQKVTAGTYRFHLVDGAGHAADLDYVVQEFTLCGYIEVSNSTLNTQSLAGAHVGSTCATTANNGPSWSITDPGGYFAINTASGERTLAKQIPSAGAYPYTVTVTDGLDSFSQTFSLTVIAGVLLDASHMSFAGCTTAFTNDTRSNVIGVPTVTGLSGTVTWSLLSQTGLAEAALANGVPARFLQDAGTGNLTAPGLLSAGLDGTSPYTDMLQLLATDGSNTIIATLPITTSWAAVSKTLHVGRGKSTATGLTGPNPSGYETMAAAKYAGCMGNHGGTFNVLVYADADPNYYANDNGPTDPGERFDWIGPLRMIGVAANGVSQPRMGGPTANNVAAGANYIGKGFIISGDGDFVLQNVEGSGCHDAYNDGIHGIEFIRKDGAVMGNLSVLNCNLHDNDTNVLTAFGHQRWLIDSSILSSGGTSYVGTGATHGAYLGEGYEAIVNNTVSRRATNGHLIKSRCKITRITSSRIYDGIGGSASACLEFPSGGEVHVLNTVIEKGMMAQGPDAIRYGAEGCQWPANSLEVRGCTISLLGLGGNHFGGPSIVGWWYGAGTSGLTATCTVDGNSVFLGPDGMMFNPVAYYAPSPNITLAATNTTTLTIPPAIDMTRPDLGSGTLPTLGALYRGVTVDNYQNYGSNLQQLGTKDQLRVSAAAAVGTPIDTIIASNDLGQQGAGTANPFGAGTSWQIINDAGPHPPPGTPFDLTHFSLTTNGNGSVVPKVAATLTANTVYHLQLRATAPNGAVCDMRLPIVGTP